MRLAASDIAEQTSAAGIGIQAASDETGALSKRLFIGKGKSSDTLVCAAVECASAG